MTILDQLTGCARERTVQAKLRISLEELKQQALSLPKGNFTFEKAIKKPGLSFICECKKASPSKGIIAQEFPYLQIAKDYEAAGADCISVLTEPKWFLGSDQYLKKIADAVSVPGARMIGVNNRNLKDFSVDTGNSRRFRKLIPPDVLFVSESGVSSVEDVRKLCEIGADAVLIGETLMRAENKAAKLAELRGVL